MRLYLFYIIIPFLAYPFLTTNCQKDYRDGNEAYYYEKKMGFNPVTIGRGNNVYTYDHANKLYINGDQILIPDLDTTPDGSTINKNEFYGFGLGGNATDTAFQWDAQYLISQPNKFDVVNMFVSPLSSNTMSYGKAIQTNGNSCNYGDCYAIVDGPVETLAYSDYN